ncbi:hypothetical protein B0T10DRAFT_413042 [Thelonectria olida]|uniref:Uncharacterized protein n=1 Tax=Thelonectria olida TaxID=1576542 RepID=A0A9P8VU32_9HYPO|nr:hypothetical protein B0T10DRAFT_413042 [Thelonectria olida]
MAGARGDNGSNSNRVNPPRDSVSTDEHVSDKKPTTVVTKKEKLKRHWKRFWWWYLITLIVLLAILLPIFFKIIIPKIVQNIVTGQSVPINSGALQALSPTKLNMTLNTSLDTPLGVKIDPTYLNLYNKNTSDFSPFLKLRLPEQHVHHKTEVLITNQTVTVTNETELLLWFNQFFDLPRVQLSIKADTNVHLGALKYTPELDKTIQIPSLNYLNGFGVSDMQFVFPPRNGKNMKGHLNIPNSGALTLGLGNLTFNLMSGKTRLGLVDIYDLQLRPGNNTPPFDGNFFFDELVPNLAQILDGQKAALAQGNIEFNATGNATVVDGKHVKYIEGVLNTKHIRFTIPVISILSDVVSAMLGGGSDSLFDIFGEAIGNTTLIEHLLDHWDTDNSDESELTTRTVKPKSKKRSWMWSALRLGLRRKI